MKKLLLSALTFFTLSLSAQVTLLPYSSPWKYLDNGTDQGTAWYGTGFNDGSWASGNAELGYGDGDEATVVSYGPSSANKYCTTYFRQTINVASVATYTSYTVNFRRDDGVILYINGVEVLRNNMPASGVTYTTYASTNCADDGGTVISATLPASVITTGTNVIAAEIHQTNASSSDLTWTFELIANTNFVIPQIVKGPYLQVGTQNSMIVRWESNVATDSKVCYGTSSVALTSTVTNPAPVTTHIMQITGLTPYTKYYYSIGSSTFVIQGDQNNYFQTSPVPGTPGNYRFWLVGDCGNGSTNQINVKNQFVAFNGPTKMVDGWLMSGDNAYSSGTNSEFNNLFFNIYQPDVMKKMVLWSAPGNHDYNNGASTATTVPYFSFFSTPTNAEAGGVPSNNPAFYSYDYGNIHFISLDSYGTVSGNKMYDTLGAQAVWLKADLAANTKRWTIAYWHHPPYTMGSHNSDSEGDLVNIRTRFIRILERNKVDMILVGHSHDYERSKLMKGHYGNEASFSAATHNLSTQSGVYDGTANSCPYIKDSINAKNGTVYVVSGSAGQLGGQQGAFPHNAMHYSNSTNGGSMIFDIQDNRLDAQWLCADGVVRDKFTIFKDVNAVKTFTVLPTQTTNISASWPGTYTWSTASSTQSISVTPTANTSYWVKDVNSCIADSFVFKVLPAVSFNFTGTYCAGNSIPFNDLSTNTPVSWVWSVSPSIGVTISSPTVNNPGITFTNPGTYSVTLTSNNTFGPGTPYSQTIIINPNPIITTVSSPTSAAICIGGSITLSAGGATTYTWTGGITDATAFTPTTSSVYSVTGTDVNGCMNTTSQAVTVNQLPVVSAISNPSTAIVCSGTSITLSGSGASTYVWTGGITDAVAFTPTASAIYTVTGTDANGCQNTAIQNVTVNNLPTVSVSSTPVSPVICIGGSVTLTGNGATTYAWTGGITNAVAFTPTASLTYSVTGTDINGCQNTSSQAVTVNPLPTVSANTSNSLICVGQTATITATGATTYSWNTSATTSAIVISPTITTTYSVIGTDANNCNNTTSFTQSVSTCAGINAFTQNQHINIYPNPSNGIFTLEMNVTGNFEIEAYNVIGELVYTGKLHTGSNTVDLKTQAGIYYYTILDDRKIIHQGKLIVE